ncbi:MAG: hypothetical protein LBE37_08300 [Sphingobacterium sp.]|nr:hypothetical protein [Sphingobacterium sp.]
MNNKIEIKSTHRYYGLHKSYINATIRQNDDGFEPGIIEGSQWFIPMPPP